MQSKYHDISYVTAMTLAEYKSDFETTKHAPYLALVGELWGVFGDDFGENIPRYNRTTL